MFGDGFDLNALMAQAQKMQEDMSRMQEQLAAREFTGAAGGGLVSLKLSGQAELLSVSIKPEAVEDVETLQDLIIAAYRDAKSQLEKVVSESMPSVPGLGM